MDGDQPAQDDRERDDAPHLDADVEAEEHPGHRAAAGRPGTHDSGRRAVREREQREQEERALGRDEPGRPLDIRGPSHTTYRAPAPRAARRPARLATNVTSTTFTAPSHEGKPRGGERGGIADQVAQRHERRQHDQDPGG